MSSTSFLVCILFLVLTCSPTFASAEEACDDCLDSFQLLRRLSLDLRQQVPSYQEYQQVDPQSGVPGDLISQWVDSSEFRAVSNRFHADLLWPSLQLTKLTIPPFRVLERGASDILGVGGAAAAKRRRAWREDPDIQCLDQLQTEFDERTIRNQDGSPVYVRDQNGNPTNVPMTYTVPVPIVTEIDGEEVRQEGYVLVRPYWAPNTQVKACAYVAMTNTHTPEFGDSFEPKFNADGSAKIASCAAFDALVNEGCGCGEDLRYCFGPGIEKDVQDQLSLQLLKLIEAHALGSKPYSEMLTTDKIYTNERILYWWKYLSEVTSLNREFNHYSRGDAVLKSENGSSVLDYSDDTWFLTDRDVALDASGNVQNFAAKHSGILTLPGFTMRFQTNRARANRFRIAFMGEYFVPSDNIEDETLGDDCSNTAADLTQRCTCRSCHIKLEPMAASWGVVAEGGSGMISDRVRFPLYREDCAPEVFGDPSDSDYDALSLRKEYCPRFWISDEGKENPGVLRPYQFVYDPNANGAGLGGPKANLSSMHQDIYDNLEAGPEKIAQEIIDNGTFHRTMVLNLFKFFVGRDMVTAANDPNSELQLLETLAAEFKQHDNFKTMVKRIVSLDQYRRVKQ